MIRLAYLAALALSLAPSIGQAQQAPARPPLTVGGEVEHPLTLSAADLAAMPRKSVVAKDHKGVEATWEGVPLIDLLTKAGVRTGDRLRGEALADFLVVEAADGYRAVFAIPEVDPAFSDRVILLADRRDGRPLSEPTEGPFRIVVPGEKKHARWVRQVVRLTVRRVPMVPS